MAPRACVCAAVATLAGACAREPDPDPSPELAPGELVITELRGAQSGANDAGQFLEVWNGSGASVDLYGVSVEFLRLDGSATARAIVRAPLMVGVGEYATLGPGLIEAQPPYVDYAMQNDFSGSLYASGAVSVFAQGELIDRVVYAGLPSTGAYALGLAPPDALGNDDAGAWCTDDTVDGSGLAVGSPGEENPACP